MNYLSDLRKKNLSSKSENKEQIENKDEKYPLPISTKKDEKINLSDFVNFLSPQLIPSKPEKNPSTSTPPPLYLSKSKVDVQKPFIVAIGGGSCAGKKNLSKVFEETLTKYFKNSITILPMENFYKVDLNPKTADFDHPDSIDWKLFEDTLTALKEKRSITIPIYDILSEKIINTKEIKSSDVVIVEGCLSFYVDKFRDQFHLKIYLDSDEDIRLSRRVYKDVCIKKKNVKDVLEKYIQYVKPDFEKFVMPYKKYADLIIPNYGEGFVMNYKVDFEGHFFEDDIGFGNFENTAIKMLIDQIGKILVS